MCNTRIIRTYARHMRDSAAAVVIVIMSLSRLPEIPRSFAEWGTEQVIEWLATLQLSNDYSKQFRDHNIDGPSLLRLNPSSLSSLGITDSLDRVKLLQQITTMQADLASLTTPARRWKGSGKFRRFSENNPPIYRTLTAPSWREESKSRQTLGVSQTLPRHGITDTVQQNRLRTQSVHSFPETTSSTTGTLYSITDTTNSVVGTSHSDVGVPHSESALPHNLTRMAYSDVGPDRCRSTEGRREVGRVQLRRKLSNIKEKKKRLSRSVDKLWEAQLAASPLPLVSDTHSKYNRGIPRYHSTGAQFQDSLAHQDSVAVRLHNGPSHRSTASVHLHDGVGYNESGTMRMHENARLVEILREENVTLKRELEIYYQRVCKLMRLEQELDRVQEAHRLLEESSVRRERLEAAMRNKMEQQIVRLRRGSEQSRNHNEETLIMVKDDSDTKLERRESVNKKKLDLEIFTVDTDDPEVYSKRIDRLKEHLKSLQQISSRREGLERRLRTQLQDEIQQLRGREEENQGENEDIKDKEDEKTKEVEMGKGIWKRDHIGKNWETEVTVLQADLAKWEQKCTELEAEKELAVEAALVHKETHIIQLKQALVAKEEEMVKLTQKSESCYCQLVEAQRNIAQLETRPSNLQSTDHNNTTVQHESPANQVHGSPQHKALALSHHNTLPHQLHESPHHQVHPLPHHKLHTSPPHQVHSSPPHQLHSSPPHQLHSSPPHQLHSSPPHQLHSSPPHQVHSSPPHQLHSSPPHQLHSSPLHQTHISTVDQVHMSPPSHHVQSSPLHRKHTPPHHIIHTSPGHETHSSPSPSHHVYPNHQHHSSPPAHTSPSHQTHHLSPRTSPTKKSTTGSMMELSLGSSPSPSSSLLSEPQLHLDTLIYRDHHTPYLTNGGGDPVTNTSLHPTGSTDEHSSTTKRHNNEEVAPVINSSLVGIPLRSTTASPLPSSRPSTVGASPKHRISDNTQEKPSPSTDIHHYNVNQSDTSSDLRVSTTNPRHMVRRVQSKTPPPRSEVRIPPKNYKYSSLDRGPTASHTPSELQLFNTLLGDAAPGETGSGRGVKPNGKPIKKGVTSLFSHPHGNIV